MPVIFLLAVLVIYGAANIHTDTTKNTKAHTGKELDNMLGEMVGKSKKDARKVLKKYRK